MSVFSVSCDAVAARDADGPFASFPGRTNFPTVLYTNGNSLGASDAKP